MAIARAGHGAMYLDPHGDAIDLVKHYLGDVAERVEEINLGADPDQLQAGWNPISMAGLGRYDIESKVSAVVDSFAAALNWGEINNRALTLTTMAVQSLCELALQVPDDIAPTIFQITTLLADEEWRTSVVPFLSPPAQAFWTTRFPKLSADAITPVTNLIDRLRSSPTVAASVGLIAVHLRRAPLDGRRPHRAVVDRRHRGLGDTRQLLRHLRPVQRATGPSSSGACSSFSTTPADPHPARLFIDARPRPQVEGKAAAHTRTSDRTSPLGVDVVALS